MKRLILLTILLAGCATPQERAAQAEAQRQAYVANLQRQCNALGFQHGTDSHRQCMLQLHQQNQQNRAAIGAAIIQSGALNRPAPVINPPPPSYRSPTTTNCYRVGNNVSCTTQ